MYKQVYLTSLQDKIMIVILTNDIEKENINPDLKQDLVEFAENIDDMYEGVEIHFNHTAMNVCFMHTTKDLSKSFRAQYAPFTGELSQASVDYLNSFSSGEVI